MAEGGYGLDYGGEEDELCELLNSTKEDLNNLVRTNEIYFLSPGSVLGNSRTVTFNNQVFDTSYDTQYHSNLSPDSTLTDTDKFTTIEEESNDMRNKLSSIDEREDKNSAYRKRKKVINNSEFTTKRGWKFNSEDSQTLADLVFTAEEVSEYKIDEIQPNKA
jgi:hypothetical protein